MTTITEGIHQQIARAESLLAKACGVAMGSIDLDDFNADANARLSQKAKQIIKTLQVLPADGQKPLLDRYTGLVDQLATEVTASTHATITNPLVRAAGFLHRNFLLNGLRHLALIGGTVAGINLPPAIALPIAAVVLASGTLSGASLWKSRPGLGMLAGAGAGIAAFAVGLVIATSEPYRGGIAMLWIYTMLVAALTVVRSFVDYRKDCADDQDDDDFGAVHESQIGAYLDPVTGEFSSFNAGGYVELLPPPHVHRHGKKRS